MNLLPGRFQDWTKDGRKSISVPSGSWIRLVCVTWVLGLLACHQSPVMEAETSSEPGDDKSIRQDGGDPTSDSGAATRSVVVERLSIKVLAVHPHDPVAFTQGLVWDGGVLYESTGLYGRSSLRRVEPMTGEVLERRMVDPNLFGEGLARVGGKLLQLTWKAGIALVYDVGTLEQIDEYGFNGEGWGLAYDGQRLMMSDGSHRLTVRDPEDFRWLETIEVRLAGSPVPNLNELEFAEGDLYANVWGDERIVRIDPFSGAVTATIDASDLLLPEEKARVDVLNGIAYDPVSRSFWLTGKFWPKIFQVSFVPAA